MMRQRFFRRPLRPRRLTPPLGNVLLGCLLCLSIIGFSSPFWSVVGLPVTAQTVPTLSNSNVVSWEDLRPPSVTDFVDPYADLTTRQLIDLAELSRIEFGPDEVTLDSDVEEGQRLRQKFHDQGLDVDWLLAQVEGVTNHYTQQAKDTNQEINQTVIKVLGYILPLTQEHDQVADFLLVPFIGACVHVPPPPPNQMVYVKPPQAIDDPGLFAQVWLEGTIYPQPSSHEFFRVDGEQQVEVSYRLDMTSMTPYQSSAEPSNGLSFDGISPEHLASANSSFENALDPSAIPKGYYQDYPLWQRIQVQTSALFTQTMVRIKNQGGWQALPLGLFMAFGYGVLHTLGPGHGKAVIVSYFIGKDGSWQRGVIMGIRIALFHVISAIAIVILAHVILEQTIGTSASSYRIVRILSYAAIAIIGLWMLRQAMTSQRHELPMQSLDQAPASPSAQPPKLGGPNTNLLYSTLTEQVLAIQDRSPQPKAISIAGMCSCLTCKDRSASGNWLSVAVGAVPCSGALLVLLYGLGNNLLWPSVLMVLAISLGMAITLSLIGVMAIWGQTQTRRRIRFNLRRQRWWSRWGPILGASLVCLIGLFMLGFTLASTIADISS